ncbi:hypothetical protein DFP72DRAFT_843874 [Ephemerocybe angulata]|uniref:Uncharacterized protein n=1 Tax=Ephemerocybe angulata TaxID=980116 RepID=A0A8H6I8G0_9AGAR|nr:hypothetical protein DFP72DRAFT_843874 [Tulosesus angulatus]
MTHRNYNPHNSSPDKTPYAVHIDVQLSPLFLCHDDPRVLNPYVLVTGAGFQAAALSLARSRYFDQTSQLIGTNAPQSPAPSIPSYAATWYAPQHSARGKNSCCVFVILGALTCFRCATTYKSWTLGALTQFRLRAFSKQQNPHPWRPPIIKVATIRALDLLTPHSDPPECSVEPDSITIPTPCSPDSFLSCLHHPGCFDILRAFGNKQTLADPRRRWAPIITAQVRNGADWVRYARTLEKEQGVAVIAPGRPAQCRGLGFRALHTDEGSVIHQERKLVTAHRIDVSPEYGGAERRIAMTLQTGRGARLNEIANLDLAMTLVKAHTSKSEPDMLQLRATFLQSHSTNPQSAPEHLSPLACIHLPSPPFHAVSTYARTNSPQALRSSEISGWTQSQLVWIGAQKTWGSTGVP